MPGAIEPPNLGEALRRVEAVSKQLSDLAHEMKEDRAAFAATYVRRDVYEEARKFDGAVVHDLNGDLGALREQTANEITTLKKDTGREIKELKDQRAADIATRRQMVLALLGMGLTLLAIIVGAIINLTVR